MRDCKKNMRDMFYALYKSKVPILDEDGNDTFEFTLGYSEPVKFKGSLSTGKGWTQEAPFGVNANFDRMICSCDMDLPINENAIIWVRSKPTFHADGSVDPTSADYKVSAPPIDGLNSMRYAVQYVSHTEDVGETVVTKPSTDTETGSEEDGF